MPLSNALQILIGENYQSFLLTIQCNSVAIYSHSDGRFRIFDSHAQDSFGLLHPQGTSIPYLPVYNTRPCIIRTPIFKRLCRKELLINFKEMPHNKQIQEKILCYNSSITNNENVRFIKANRCNSTLQEGLGISGRSR